MFIIAFSWKNLQIPCNFFFLYLRGELLVHFLWWLMKCHMFLPSLPGLVNGFKNVSIIQLSYDSISQCMFLYQWFPLNSADSDTCLIKFTIQKLWCLVVSFWFKICWNRFVCQKVFPTKEGFILSWWSRCISTKSLILVFSMMHYFSNIVLLNLLFEIWAFILLHLKCLKFVVVYSQHPVYMYASE